MLLTLAPTKIKYLGINVTKYVSDLYEENYIILMNKIKEELKKVETYLMLMHRKHQRFQGISSQLAINKINTIPVVGEQNLSPTVCLFSMRIITGRLFLSHRSLRKFLFLPPNCKKNLDRRYISERQLSPQIITYQEIGRAHV